MNYIVTYDIANDQLRLKIATFLLQQACQRIQKSVYLAPNWSHSEWNQFEKTLKTTFQTKLTGNDSLYIIPVQRKQLSDAIIFGNSKSIDNFLKEVFYFFF